MGDVTEWPLVWTPFVRGASDMVGETRDSHENVCDRMLNREKRGDLGRQEIRSWARVFIPRAK